MKARVSLGLIFICLLSFIVALQAGSISFSFNQLISALLGQEGIARTIVYDLRLPRALAAFVCGGMLALAGTLMQALLRNPLADPYILGVSGGAASAALIAILLGFSSLMIQISSFAGALLSILLVFFLAHSHGSWTSSRLLLTGVVLAAGWNALISFLLSVSPGQQVHSLLFWLMGDLSNTHLSLWQVLLLVFMTLVSFALARPLNLITRGELQAAALGLNIKSFRILIFFIASGMTAVAISLAGSIGFIGLMAPHILRLIIGSDHRILVPLSVLLGGCLLLLADTLARTVLAPIQLPVGVLTAMLGVPLFLALLYKKQK